MIDLQYGKTKVHTCKHIVLTKLLPSASLLSSLVCVLFFFSVPFLLCEKTVSLSVFLFLRFVNPFCRIGGVGRYNKRWSPMTTLPLGVNSTDCPSDRKQRRFNSFKSNGNDTNTYTRDVYLCLVTSGYDTMAYDGRNCDGDQQGNATVN